MQCCIRQMNRVNSRNGSVRMRCHERCRGYYSYNYLACCIVVPGPPTDLRAEVTRSQSESTDMVDVRLTWKPPSTVNGVVRSYKISLSTNSSLPDHLWTNIVSNGSITVLEYIQLLLLYVACFSNFHLMYIVGHKNVPVAQWLGHWIQDREVTSLTAGWSATK